MSTHPHGIASLFVLRLSARLEACAQFRARGQRFAHDLDHTKKRASSEMGNRK